MSESVLILTEVLNPHTQTGCSINLPAGRVVAVLDGTLEGQSLESGLAKV